jgi:hypothetical protein
MPNPNLTNILNLAICLYGLNEDKELVQRIRKENDRIFPGHRLTYFETTSDPILHRNLWLASFKKRQHELNNIVEFDACLALNIEDKWVTDFLYSPTNPVFDLIINPLTFKNMSDEKLYFVKGAYSKGFTVISPSVFFASSLLFDLACNFSIARPTFPKDRARETDDEDFYYFLKTLKIRTECTNYENSSLFKRTT